jgi:hypothetical protein
MAVCQEKSRLIQGNFVFAPVAAFLNDVRDSWAGASPSGMPAIQDPRKHPRTKPMKMIRNISIPVTAIASLFALAQSASAALTYTSATRGDGKTVVTFTADSGTWTIPDGVTTIELMVVGGGGSGSYWGYQNVWGSGPCWGGGGGGGGVALTTTSVPSGGSVNITVGTGGGAGNTGTSGGDSLFGTVIAYGGGGSALGSGGASGGYSLDGGGTIVSGYAGGTDSGGGGGAGEAGQGGWYTQAGGGDGNQSSITGTVVLYGGGGSTFYNGAVGGLDGGGSTYDAYYLTPESHGNPNGVDGLGGGGAGGRNALSEVGAGGSGVVIVAYTPIPEASASLLLIAGGGLGLLRRRR